MYENSKGFRVSRLLKTEIGNDLHEATSSITKSIKEF
jgi:hypothetical protein